MQLSSGRYLGTTTREVKTGALTASITRYEPMQEQPWHTHEHPTFFIQLTGDHIDGSPEGDRSQQALTVTYHPALALHRSRIGTRGALGVNIEAPFGWLEAHGFKAKELGDQRILSAISLKEAAIKTLAFASFANVNGDEIESAAIEIVEPFLIESGSSRASENPKWLRRAEERLRSDFRSPLSLRLLASEACVHSVYFARAFRKRHACSVGEYVQKLRLHYAADLILGGMSAGEAAVEAGFADQFHLSRLLKKRYALLPKYLKALSRGEGSKRSSNR
jgi:AraC family transcriptional regulator